MLLLQYQIACINLGNIFTMAFSLQKMLKMHFHKGKISIYIAISQQFVR